MVTVRSTEVLFPRNFCFTPLTLTFFYKRSNARGGEFHLSNVQCIISQIVKHRRSAISFANVVLFLFRFPSEFIWLWNEPIQREDARTRMRLWF